MSGTTSDTFVAKVLRRCFWPTTNAPLSSADILAIADEEIAGDFRQLTAMLQGNWYLTEQDYAITAEQMLYRLPSRMFGPVVDVVLVNSAGDEISLTTINVRDVGHYSSSGRGPFSHVLQGDFVRLFPTPSSTQDTLRIKHYRKPNDLVLSASALQITAVTLASDQLTFGSDPDTLFDTTDEVDVISDGNSHSLLTYENAISAFPGGNVATLTADLSASQIAVGDWMAPTGQTPILPIPDELVTALVKRTASECLRAAGERDAAMQEEESADAAWTDAEALLRDRSEAEPKTIITRNSALRSRMSFGVVR